jgi:hypothetical protein
MYYNIYEKQQHSSGRETENVLYREFISLPCAPSSRKRNKPGRAKSVGKRKEHFLKNMSAFVDEDAGTAAGDGSDAADFLEDDNINEDIANIKIALVNEKAAPELLPFESQIVTDLKEQIQNQQDIIDEARESGADGLATSLYQVEV